MSITPLSVSKHGDYHTTMVPPPTSEIRDQVFAEKYITKIHFQNKVGPTNSEKPKLFNARFVALMCISCITTSATVVAEH